MTLYGNIPLFTNKILEGYLNSDIIPNNKTPQLKNISFYSKELKEALRYFINPKYLDNYEHDIYIENKYCDKHNYYLQHKLLYGNKLQCLHKDYLPYTNPLKNEQYLLQKQMQFDIPSLKQNFIKRYPKIINIPNWWQILKNIKYKQINCNIDKELLKYYLGEYQYQDCLRLFSICLDYHNHIFKASEKYRQNIYAFSYFT